MRMRVLVLAHCDLPDAEGKTIGRINTAGIIRRQEHCTVEAGADKQVKEVHKAYPIKLTDCMKFMNYCI